MFDDKTDAYFGYYEILITISTSPVCGRLLKLTAWVIPWLLLFIKAIAILSPFADLIFVVIPSIFIIYYVVRMVCLIRVAAAPARQRICFCVRLGEAKRSSIIKN